MNGAQFTQSIKDLTLEGKVDEAQKLLATYISSSSSQPLRVVQATTLIEGVRRVVEAGYDDALRVMLRDFDNPKPQKLQNIDDVLAHPPGLYAFGEDLPRPSSFDYDFHQLSPDLRDHLRMYEFGARTTSSNREIVRVFNGAVIFAEHLGLLTCASYEGEYDRLAASRLAKATRINFRRTPSRFLDRAIVIPAPHHVRNYYHVTTECAYYLRYAAGNSHKVIVPEDAFGVIGFVADRLGISRDRIISYNDARDLFIHKAAMPIPGGNFWSKEIYQFFGRLSAAAGDDRRIYVSRSLSGRGPDNEAELEAAMAGQGFRVVHPEKMTVEQQAALFAGADFIVAPHGAGLANLLFTKPGCRLVEIFRSEFVCRDFYLRSRHNNMRYFPLVFQGSLDVDVLRSAVEAVDGMGVASAVN